MTSWSIEGVSSLAQIDEVLVIEQVSFTSPWTREMYLAELANAGVSFCFLVRTDDGRSIGFCSL